MVKETARDVVVQAWREQWTELEWSIRIKGFGGTLVEFATMSDMPNLLILTYLNNARCCKLVNEKLCLKAILYFNEFHKHHCVGQIIALVKNLLPPIRWQDADGDLMVNLVSWTLTGSRECPNSEHFFLLIDEIFRSQYFRACFYLATLQNQEQSLQSIATSGHADLDEGYETAAFIEEMLANPKATLWFVDAHICDITSGSTITSSASGSRLSGFLVGMMSVWGTIRFPEPLEHFVSFVQSIQSMQNLNWGTVYQSIIRGSFLLQLDATATQESCSTAFAFLKVPRLLKALCTTKHQSELLVTALEEVAISNALLNRLDLKNHCDTFECFLKQFTDVKLLSDDTIKNNLLQLRSTERDASLGNPTGSSQASINLVIKAAPTFETLLKSFSSDFAKNHTNVVKMMQHMVTGKSFEFICAAAAATGSLQLFVEKLIIFNESSASLADDDGSSLEASLFDLSFLLLSRIHAVFELQCVMQPTCTSVKSETETFFYIWCNTLSSARDFSVDVDNGESIFKELRDGIWTMQGNIRDISTSLVNVVHYLLGCDTVNDETLKLIFMTLGSASCSLPLIMVQYLTALSGASSGDSTSYRKLACSFQQVLPDLFPMVNTETPEKKHADRYTFMVQIARRLLSSVITTMPSSVVFPWLNTTPSGDMQSIPPQCLPKLLIGLWREALRCARFMPNICVLLARVVKDGMLDVVAQVWLTEFSKLSSARELEVGSDLFLSTAFFKPEAFPASVFKLILKCFTEKPQLFSPPQGLSIAPLLVQLLTLSESSTPHSSYEELVKTEDQIPGNDLEAGSSKRLKIDPESTSPDRNSESRFTPVQLAFLSIVHTASQSTVVDIRLCFGGMLVKTIALYSHCSTVAAILSSLPDHFVRSVIRSNPDLVPPCLAMKLYDLSSENQRKKAIGNLGLLRSLRRI